MNKLTLEEICSAVEGKLSGETKKTLTIDNITTDS